MRNFTMNAVAQPPRIENDSRRRFQIGRAHV